ncbi:MAG: hypothetical protein Q9176_005416 [Flavoplaca citrina]
MEERAENAAPAVARGMAADQDRGTCDWARSSEAGGRRSIGSCVFSLGEVGLAKVVVMKRVVEKVGSLEFILDPTFPIAFTCGDDDVLIVEWDGVVQWLDSVDIEVRRHLDLTSASVAWCYGVNGQRSLGACRIGGEEVDPSSGNLLLSEIDKTLRIRSSRSFFDNVVLFHPPPTSSVGYASTFNLQVPALKDCARYVGTDPEEFPCSTSSVINPSATYRSSAKDMPETETWATYLATRIQHDHIIKQPTTTNGPIRILDLCTGSGCISLLLFALLSAQSIPLQILGLDISQAAVKLAQHNLIHNISKGFLPASALSHIDFPQGDIFAKDRSWKECEYDIVVSNPPYISPVNYNRTTTRSVRNHEPKTALVPTFTSGSDVVVGDAFYPRIISIARDTKAKALVMEVGDMHQARRVVQLVGKSRIWQKMEIWPDGVLDHHSPHIVTDHLGAYIITIRGKGEARAVAVWGRSGEGP